MVCGSILIKLSDIVYTNYGSHQSKLQILIIGNSLRRLLCKLLNYHKIYVRKSNKTNNIDHPLLEFINKHLRSGIGNAMNNEILALDYELTEHCNGKRMKTLCVLYTKSAC